jgi:Fe-S-cluster-containing dehydrogenase component/DMSO reductase anchor subunit
MTQALFILDLDRCTGCAACVVACNNLTRNSHQLSAAASDAPHPAEFSRLGVLDVLSSTAPLPSGRKHRWPRHLAALATKAGEKCGLNLVAENLSWRKIHTFNPQRLPAAPVFHLSLACNHCLEPACLVGCPANAYTKDPRTGAVLIDEDTCMGCRYCSWVCPYEAPQFNPTTGIMEKCTFCDNRQADGLAPACVIACPTDALRFEPEGEPSTVEHAGFPDTGIGPAVRIVGDRRRSGPEMTAAPVQIAHPIRSSASGWQGLRSEWSLWFFTSAAALLVAWFTAAVTLGHTVALPFFAAGGILAMAVSALHLGKITRVWRGILNVRSSWISREAAFFSAFFGAACALTLVGGGLPRAASWGAAVLGFAALFSMDMVYRVPGQPAATVPHSAMATLTAAFYIGILLDAPMLFWPTAVLKLALYLVRRDHPKPGARLTAAIRIGVGLALPLVILATSTAPPVVALIGAILGELVDRAEFYATLRFLTPSCQLDADLGNAED